MTFKSQNLNVFLSWNTRLKICVQARAQLYMVMWSHWNHVENKNLLIHHSDKLKWKKMTFYTPACRWQLWIPSPPSHMLEISLQNQKKNNVTYSKLSAKIISVFFLCLLICVVMLIPSIPRPTYMHPPTPLTHRSWSPVSAAGRGSRGSWWSCLAPCTSVQQAAWSDHPQRCLQQTPHAGQKEWRQ